MARKTLIRMSVNLLVARISLHTPPAFFSNPLHGWDAGTLTCGHRTHTVRFRVTPSHRPTIYVHGIMATPDFWPLTLPKSLRDYGGCSISLPNHSTRSQSAHPGSTSERDQSEQVRTIPKAMMPEDFSRPIIQLINEVYEGKPTRLVGWSTGGFAVLHAAATHPEKVESVVSICGFARGPWNGGLGLLQAMAQRRRRDNDEERQD
mgnify:CR=1 FL=1